MSSRPGSIAAMSDPAAAPDYEPLTVRVNAAEPLPSLALLL
jgi:hypothetical protein